MDTDISHVVSCRVQMLLASSMSVKLERLGSLLTRSSADRCIDVRLLSLVSGFKPRYSHMNTRKMRFHRRIVGRSNAVTSSYNIGQAGRKNTAYCQTYCQCVPDFGEGIRNDVQDVDAKLLEGNMVIANPAEVWFSASTRQEEAAPFLLGRRIVAFPDKVAVFS